MPRLLPWQTAPTHSTGVSPSRKRIRLQSSSEEDLLDEDLNLIRPPKPEPKRAACAPSSSPTLPSPVPEIEYMREGFDQDDIYMMVEDEFEILARTFARKIHYDEYKKKTEEAKQRTPGIVPTHYTDGRTGRSRGTKLDQEMDAKERQIRKVMKDLDPESDDDMEGANPHLAGLITMSRRPAQDLTRVAVVRRNTRAAAGFPKSPRKIQRWKDVQVEAPLSPVLQDDSTDDSEDLDRPLRKRPASRTTSKKDTDRSNIVERNSTSTTQGPSSAISRFEKQANGTRAISIESDDNSPTVQSRKAESDRNTLFKINERPGQSISSSIKPKKPVADASATSFSNTSQDGRSQLFMARRKAERERWRREEEDREKQVKVKLEVPTFII